MFLAVIMICGMLAGCQSKSEPAPQETNGAAADDTKKEDAGEAAKPEESKAPEEGKDLPKIACLLNGNLGRSEEHTSELQSHTESRMPSSA